MQQDNFDSELRSLNLGQLREVIQQMCTSDTQPDNSEKGKENGGGRSKDNKSAALELIKSVKHRKSKGGKARLDVTQENSSSSVTPASTTLVASPTLPPLSQNEEPEASSSTEQASAPQMKRNKHRQTNLLTAEQVQNLVGMGDLEPIQRCGRCRNWFTESHNSDIACAYHHSRVQFREAELIAYVPTYAAWEHRYVPSSFRWACCGDQVGVSAGCVSTRHDAGAAPHWNCQSPPGSYDNISSRWQVRGESARAWMLR
ncbi:hypothetical protein F4775DRAFT_607213 [Biscogniauxia sp. FL1348]|nr:hypothetical protein F4775DRAFT_607213 [Biscogniauxia sp. FL1348]